MNRLAEVLSLVIVSGVLCSCADKQKEAHQESPQREESRPATEETDTRTAQLEPVGQPEPAVAPAAEKLSQAVTPQPDAVQKKPDKVVTIPQPKTSVDPNALVVDARLVEIPGTFPPNDLYNYVYVMKYRVLNVVQGNLATSEIFVGHYNPRVPRDRISDKMKDKVDGDVTRFSEGDKHRLVLVKGIENVWKDAVEDEYFDKEGDKYFALQTDMLK